ncbi:MAG: orotidine-5'-phosphate decarboxylase [Deltaproteobacteria bacterium]|nr:orotidine-5'-phosphate decarboxylase [Deltaproteobacteria bacterium]
MKNLSPKERIIFPLDFPSLKDALLFTRLLKDDVGVFKIGLELFIAEGPRAVKRVKAAGAKKIFLDLKLHDIPQTVKGALVSAVSLGVDFITVHIDSRRGIDDIARIDREKGVRLLAVTMLTSLSGEDMKDMGLWFKETSDLVLHRAMLAKDAGFAGVVCSGLEAEAVKKTCGKDFLVITPGIRLKDTKDDQKRTVTAFKAIMNGADYLVIGRPIRDSDDPVAAARAVASEIEKAGKERQI